MNTLVWTATTRAQHRRDGLRFASDVTDTEWAVIEPLLPPPSKVGPRIVTLTWRGRGEGEGRHRAG